MHTNFRLNPQFNSLFHNCLRPRMPKTHSFLQALHLILGGLLLITLLSLPTYAQFDCIDPGGTGAVQIPVSNPGAAIAAANVTATIPVNSGVTAIAGSCTATIGGVATGTCTIAPDGLTVAWNGPIPAASSLTITYRIQVAATVASGNFPITNTGTAGLIVAGATLPAVSTTNVLIGCLAQPSSNIRLSDQKPGSVLVYPYYTSITGAATNDTRISLTNVSPLASTLAQRIRFWRRRKPMVA